MNCKTYIGIPHRESVAGQPVVTVCDGQKSEPLPLRLDLFNHSPSGFSWGYGGSGPAQLALTSAAPVYRQLKPSFGPSVMVGLPELIGSTGGENDTHTQAMALNTCSCGSGKPKSAQYDARRIFLTYTCEDCHGRKMAEFRPDVLTDPDYWTDEPINDD